MSEKSCFLTLTYRDDELQWGNNAPSLYPRHLELFWKRLRKTYGTKITYFACGEYGTKGSRPHYHACVFGHDFDDKRFVLTENGNNYYSSHKLDALWSHGDCIIGDVTAASAAYVARYILGHKKLKDDNWYEKQGVEPEFLRMSRNPAIGKRWIQRYKNDVYTIDGLKDSVIVDGKKNRPPRYYDKYLEKNHKDASYLVKMSRVKKSQIMFAIKNLAAGELIKKTQINNFLTRPLE